MDPNVILMLKPFQLGNSIAASKCQTRLASIAIASLPYLLATNPFLLTNRKYLEHKSSRITAPIWLVNVKRTGRVCTVQCVKYTEHTYYTI